MNHPAASSFGSGLTGEGATEVHKKGKVLTVVVGERDSTEKGV